MRISLKSTLRFILSASFTFTALSPALAHFPWLASDEKGHAIMWFGESTEDRSYPMPAKVQAIELAMDGAKTQPKMSPVESDSLTGIRSDEPVEQKGELYGTVTYGLYHGMKLTYHVEHLPQTDWSQWPSEPRGNSSMQTLLKPAKDGGVMVTVFSEGKPVADTEVKLFCEEGHEEASYKTDADGTVTFTGREVESGLNAIMVGTKQNGISGTLDGESYTSSADYLTATFVKRSSESDAKDAASESKTSSPSKAEPKVDETSGAKIVPSELPALPEELTSFGAAITGNQIYVYGGHTGNAHSYSTEEQSDRLWGLDLSAGKEGQWKKLASGPSLQGLALVPYKDQVIRIGGFTAVNAAGEAQDLRSQSLVASYDPKSGTWKDLPSLPEGRSSFDAAVLGDTVYVFGGWSLAGESDDSTWHSTGWKLDLSDASASWQPTAPIPSARRAVSVATHKDRIYVLGGMKPDNSPTTEVDLYDPKTNQWTTGPAIPGSGMSGFGSASFAAGKDLFVSTMDGFVHRLNEAGDGWQTIAKCDPARFFHRMLPINETELLMIGGANMEIGKFTEIDKLVVK